MHNDRFIACLFLDHPTRAPVPHFHLEPRPEFGAKIVGELEKTPAASKLEKAVTSRSIVVADPDVSYGRPLLLGLVVSSSCFFGG